MNLIGLVAVFLFGIASAAGVAAWFYAVYHMVRHRFVGPRHGMPEHDRKAVRGFTLFMGCALCAMVAGSIGVVIGGW